MSRPGLRPATIRTARAICSNSSASPATEEPARLSGGEARRAALARVLAPAARHPAARRADQPSRPAGDRVARERTRGLALRAGADQPRPALSRTAVARDRMARSRHHAAHRARLCVVRGVARPGAGGRRARAAQARPQDRRRGALDALRRDRAAQAQHAPRRPARPDAQGFPRASRRAGHGQDFGERGRAVRKACVRSEDHFKEFRRHADRARLLDPHSARRPHRASSARTAPARPRC